MGEILNVPPGTWFYVRELPPDATNAEIAEWFSQAGVPVAEDSVSFRSNGKYGNTAVVSVDRKTIRDLVRWCLDQIPFRGGRQLPIELFGTSKSNFKNRW